MVNRLPHKLKQSIESHSDILEIINSDVAKKNWAELTRTFFDKIAKIINKKVTHRVFESPDLAESGLIIGLDKMESILFTENFANVKEFAAHYKKKINPFCWISGKTLQSYWMGKNAKELKLNVLCVFLDIHTTEWHLYIYDTPQKSLPETSNLNAAAISVLKKYYLGNYALYYPKTDGSPVINKTFFIIKEDANGEIIINTTSEGHKYIGRIKSIRDGCLYIDCKNEDWEELEQYIFNIGSENNPEVLFGVSNTVSVKRRQSIGLKNVLVKQRNMLSDFDKIPELEIPMHQKLPLDTEEGVMLHYFKSSGCNLISTQNSCSLNDLRNGN